jgi:excisionase family DNA binding protein
MSSLITVKEAAKRLSLSESKVYRMTMSGELYSKRLGRAVRIPEESIQALTNLPKSDIQSRFNGGKP